jgi:hypothetical protein
MSETYLTLAGYTFSGFGVPEKINGGGKHHLVVHKLIGGQRVIDAMGPDDDEIEFRGRFRGAGAMADAMLMEAIRRAGAPVVLTYYNLTYTVVVSSFKWSFERFFEVPYELQCVVVTSSTAGSGETNPTLPAAVSSDVALAQKTAGGSVKTQAAVAPVATQNSQVNLGSLTDQQQMQSTVNGSTVRLGQIASPADVPPGPPGGVVAGGAPGAMATGATTQAQTMTDGAAAQNTLPVMQRASVNLGSGYGGQ